MSFTPLMLESQINLFGETEPAYFSLPEDLPLEDGMNWQLGEGVNVVQSGDCAQLIVSGFGLYLGKKSERLVVKKGKEAVYEFPFFRLSEVVIDSRGISLSSDVIEELCVRGISVSFLSGGGRPYAMLTSPNLTATVKTRREQILAYNDARGFELSRTIVEGKIANQEKLLRYFGKYLKESDPVRFATVDAAADSLGSLRVTIKAVKGATIDDGRGSLMAIEGRSARAYWEAAGEIVKGKLDFFGREHRGATDVMNALLNYGYGILYSHIWGAVLNAGLEPFAGFLHVDRSGKPSLVLDLVEEFRQPVVDRAVISHINLGEPVEMKDGLLTQDTRRRFAQKVIERLEAAEPFRGKKYQVRSIIQMQARQVVLFLRGEGSYKPFAFKW
ncbi:MAG: CRISPR-associated endonuclease Cas1 [Elusimicrobiota bacterium]